MKKIFKVIFVLFLLTLLAGCAGALHSAAANGDTKAIKELLDGGANINENSRGGTPLVYAAAYGNVEAVKMLVERGADVNAATSPFSGNWSPLMYAASGGHANIAKLLIEKGADIESALAKLKKHGTKDGYELLERLAKKQQPPRYGASPPMLPTALPLPTEGAAPF